MGAKKCVEQAEAEGKDRAVIALEPSGLFATKVAQDVAKALKKKKKTFSIMVLQKDAEKALISLSVDPAHQGSLDAQAWFDAAAEKINARGGGKKGVINGTGDNLAGFEQA